MKKKKEVIQEIEEQGPLELTEHTNNVLRFICGVCIGILSIIFFVCILGVKYVPSLYPFYEVISYGFGKCAILLPICLAIICASIFSDENYVFLNIKNLGLILIFVALCGIVHHSCVEVKQELYPYCLPIGGGFIGGVLTLFLHKYFDSTMTYAFLIICLISGTLCLIPYLDTLKVLVYPFTLLKKFITSKFYDINKDSSENIEDENTMESSKSLLKNDTEQSNKSNISSISFQPNQDAISQSEYKGPLTAREIIARRSRMSLTEKSNQIDNGSKVNSVHDLYNRKEFKEFNDGIRNENVIQRIFRRGYSDDVYSEAEVKKNIRENPVEIPNWQNDDVTTTGKTIFGASMYTNQNTERPKVIPLYDEDNFEKDNNQGQPAEQNETFIKHYRENAIDDVTTNIDIAEMSNKDELKPVRRDPYRYPKVDLLDKPRHVSSSAYEKDILKQCEILKQTLDDFRVSANVTGVTRGPSVTRFEVQPSAGVKVSSITNLADDIALKLATSGVRIEAPIPGKAAIGIEVPNLQNDAVYIKEIIDDDIVKHKESPLCIGLGKDISGNVITADISKMPHLLVAGSTGSGKSVCINSILTSILYKAHPDEVKFILVDPKVVELSNYNGIPHLLTPVVTDMKKAASALHWAVKEMERRYSLFAETHVREINAYNLTASSKLPFIVVIIDELSDLMMVARIDVEDAILRLAQKARAAGIHLILATQRPSVDVITGIIKANIPSRIAFAVSSQTDSRTILDIGGAEKLIGKGDMLYFPVGVNKPIRVQGAFVSDGELNRVVEFISKQSLPLNYVEEVTSQTLSTDKNSNDFNADNVSTNDDLFSDAISLVMDVGQASSSMLQRRFRIGYTRAARIVDTMEKMGIIGPAVGSKPREVIMTREEIEEKFFNKA